MALRYYSSTARETTLTSGVDDSAVTLSVAATTGFPSSVPFTLILGPETPNEEVVEVTAVSGTTLTVTRGLDSTPAVSHASDTVVRHGVSARDFREPNEFINGTGTVTTTRIADAAVTAAKIAYGDGLTASTTSLVIDSSVARRNASNTIAGTVTANSFIVTSSTAPTNGIYLPATDTVGITTASSVRFRIDSVGQIGIGSTTQAGQTIRIGRSITGATTVYNVINTGTIQSDVTSEASMFQSFPATAATAFTLTNLRHFNALQGTFGAGSTVTNQAGFFVSSNLTGATNNFGFYTDISADTGRWNFYANGTARNYLRGTTTIGSTADLAQLGVVSASASTVGLTVRLAASATANAFRVENSAGTVLTTVLSDGGVTAPYIGNSAGQAVLRPEANRNVALLTGSGGSYGGGQGVAFWANAAAVPSSNPSGGGVLYAEGGALKWRGSSGTITTIAAA
jgi:hypothetical protein